LRKEVKEFLSEVVDTLRPYTIDGEVVTLKKRGHLKVKGKYPSGTRSFVIGSSPSDYKWKLNAKTVLKRFIYTEILSSLTV
jgi:hypothetical protein